jgi:uncharacterized membrane protein
MITPLQYVLIYLVSVVTFFAVDMFWLVVIARNFYKTQLGSLMTDSIIWPVAIAFYLLFLVGLLIFVISPAIEAKDMMRAVLYGALFGFFTYMTYDLTNWSTLRDWPGLLSLVDMAWGTVLSTVVATVTYLVAVTYIVR